MMSLTAFPPAIAGGLAAAGRALLLRPRALRLEELIDQDAARNEAESAKAVEGEIAYAGKLGRAGFVTPDAQRRAVVCMAAFVALSTILAGALAMSTLTHRAALLVTAAALQLSGCAVLMYLRRRAALVERAILFELPLLLESLILLVASGLGVIPAIAELLGPNETAKDQHVRTLLRRVYSLSAHGMPFGESLRLVADEVPFRAVKHVFVHLDISANVGGTLASSLRSLSDYTHSEWRLSVEERVKRLENLVVFPVFVSVIGLMFVVSAVPLVALLDVRERITHGAHVEFQSQELNAPLGGPL